MRQQKRCLFIDSQCTKLDRAGVPTGVCSVYNPTDQEETIICPNRLYYKGYEVLRDVVADAFGRDCDLIHPDDLGRMQHDGKKVVGLGKRFGKEIRLPLPRSPGKKRKAFFYTDWILVQITSTGQLGKFVGVEVQSIDTTGNYQAAQRGYMKGERNPPPSEHGLNWENVNKRILPQIIFKGRVLQREDLCERGLYFLVPDPVYKRIIARLGGDLEEYPSGRGSVTFLLYDLVKSAFAGQHREVHQVGIKRSNVESIADRFTSARDLPPAGAFERHIREALGL
ncbi:MAG: hypothetical protein ACE5I9_05015 [Candidatus Methylomirabilales bacterium]